MSRCVKCKRKLASDLARQCLKCGFEWHKCARCGNEWVRGTLRCEKCGISIEEIANITPEDREEFAQAFEADMEQTPDDRTELLQKMAKTARHTSASPENQEEGQESDDGLFSEGVFGLLNKGPIGWIIFGLLGGIAYGIFEIVQVWFQGQQ